MTIVRSRISGKMAVGTPARIQDKDKWEVVPDTAESSQSAEKGKQRGKAKAKAPKPAPAAIDPPIDNAGDELDELVGQ